ncbi:MerR family transcriptional regulator [Zobellella sp. DQSA1]|uniref:MerR family transcriptional regulator n=1 Tax=Zobellella sp. DQSA1 TaxID=3342386 RepID=UPI0035C08854
MLLKVGQLAKRTGVTVRTLHHYDRIGLLIPAARSAAGYRLYNADNVARLYQIQLLKGLGLSLSAIGELMADGTPELRDSIARQREALHRQLEQARQMLEKLNRIDSQLQGGTTAESCDLLDLLALMQVYERHFSDKQLAALQAYQRPLKTRGHWQSLVAQLSQLRHLQVPPDAAPAKSLAEHWMETLEQDAARHPVLFNKLIRSYEQEQILQLQFGITREQQRYITEAFAHSRLDLYRPLLTVAEFQTMQRHYPRAMARWPALLAELTELQEAGAGVDDAQVQRLAGRWLDLFDEYTGSDPQLQHKVRQAQQTDPRLRKGSLLNKHTMDYLQAAVSHYLTSRKQVNRGRVE